MQSGAGNPILPCAPCFYHHLPLAISPPTAAQQLKRALYDVVAKSRFIQSLKLLAILLWGQVPSLSGKSQVSV